MSHGDRVETPRARVRGRRQLRRRAVRHRHRRGGAALFADVPPRGGAHARRRQVAGQFRAARLRLRRRLDDGRLPRRQDRRDPRAGRQGQGHLRPVRRGRQRGRRGADPRGDRRAADLRVRRPWPDARERGRAGRLACSAITTTSRWSMWTPSARLPRPAWPGVTDPEAKRKFIGAEFIDVFEAEAKKIGGADFLAQGTLYPDVIESVSFTGGPSVTIKSHHNVGGLPERMNMQLVEPLARIVQGRGARARPRARPARGVRRRAIRSPGPASPSASPAR